MNKFYNNLKFANRFISKSRFFFERTTKLKTTLNRFGNVYKNSKWVDFKNQNIKSTFSVQFSNLLVLLTTVSFLFFTSGRYFFELVIFIGTSISELYLLLLDGTSFCWYLALGAVCILLHGYYFVLSNTFFFKNIFFADTSTTFVESNNHLSTLVDTLGRLRTPVDHPSTLHTGGFCNLLQVLYIQQLLTRLYFLDDVFFDSFNKYRLLTLNNSINSFTYPWYLPIFFNNEYVVPSQALHGNQPQGALSLNYKGCCYSASRLRLLNYTALNANNLRLMNSLNYVTIENILSKSLSYGRQLRWLSKNTLLSQEVILNTAKFTQLKKVLGKPILNKHILTNSIWASSRFTEPMLYALGRENAVNGNTLYYGSLDLRMINFLEQSLFWDLKRFQTMHVNTMSLSYAHPVSDALLKSAVEWPHIHNLLFETPSLTYNAATGDELSNTALHILHMDADVLNPFTPSSLLFGSFVNSNLAFGYATPTFYSNLNI